MDHFYQLPGLGTPDQPMLEAYTALGALATATERVQLGTLVTGNTYRNPDAAGQGHHHARRDQPGPRDPRHRHRLVRTRARPLGYEFGTFTDRFNRLDEALQIILPMLEGERPTFYGKYYRPRRPWPNPASATTSR